ncbi:MAG: GNAT family N-acetyltransferase [Lachnospiraceae bacterium]|nr:GNAT family N-acetyltransferase [Lachnospiraceae bacterium]
MIILRENEIKLDTYLALRAAVNWKKLSREQAELALDNALYTVCAYDGEKAVGMGRIVGDGAVVVYVQDLIVLPEYQKMGIGKQLIEHLIEYVKGINQPGNEIMLCLMCAKGRESFYEKYGFISRPNDNLGPGMIQYIKE